MWPTLDGPRILKYAEADLVRGSIGVMVDHLVDEWGNEAEAIRYGIDWFDQWDCEQRIWMLQQVTTALLSDSEPPTPAAMWEATIDAIFCEVVELIELEIGGPCSHPKAPPGVPSWRQSVVDAFVTQQGRKPEIEIGEIDVDRWRRVVTQISDMILGIASYQKAESFRDSEIETTRRFLQQKCLPEDFLSRIPPLRSQQQTQASIDQIHLLIGL